MDSRSLGQVLILLRTSPSKWERGDQKQRGPGQRVCAKGSPRSVQYHRKLRSGGSVNLPVMHAAFKTTAMAPRACLSIAGLVIGDGGQVSRTALLSDSQWERIEPLLPSSAGAAGSAVPGPPAGGGKHHLPVPVWDAVA